MHGPHLNKEHENALLVVSLLVLGRECGEASWCSQRQFTLVSLTRLLGLSFVVVFIRSLTCSLPLLETGALEG